MSPPKPPLLARIEIVVVVIVVAVVVAATGVGIGTDAGAARIPANNVPPSSLGTFVGYRSFGAPHSISAEWRVPRILQSSEAHAATWIGLQSESGAFIQVGTLEDSFAGSSKGVPKGVFYTGFWSGDEVEFHPQPTFRHPLLPGDLISASISQTKSGWRLQLVDTRNRKSFVRTIRIPAADFTEAEWFQEDPTNGETNSPFPYPDLSQIRWMNLKLNGESPSFSLANQRWMSVPGRDFAPTALKDDSYGVVPVHLDSTQVRWVTAEAPYEVAAQKFDDSEGTWRAHPPSSASAKLELQPFLTALNAYDRTLATRSWPLVSPSDINELVAVYRQDAAALTALANAEPKPSTTIVARLDKTRTNLRFANQLVSNQMGLP